MAKNGQELILNDKARGLGLNFFQSCLLSYFSDSETN